MHIKKFELFANINSGSSGNVRHNDDGAIVVLATIIMLMAGNDDDDDGVNEAAMELPDQISVNENFKTANDRTTFKTDLNELEPSPDEPLNSKHRINIENSWLYEALWD